MEQPYLEITAHLLGALLAGGLIGLERSFHGRPAGFRTHALVCVTSSLLMMLTLYEGQWFPAASAGRMISLDPTRMAQGIMTGIGFLGAGVIFKEGLTVRGLTTAASIWITAGIGILIGVGFYFPAILGTLLTLGILSVFRWIELHAPALFYAHHVVRFRRDAIMPEEELRSLIAAHGFTIANLSYRLEAEGRYFEYRMVIRSHDSRNASRLAETLERNASVVEFRISPAGD